MDIIAILSDQLYYASEQVCHCFVFTILFRKYPFNINICWYILHVRYNHSLQQKPLPPPSLAGVLWPMLQMLSSS